MKKQSKTRRKRLIPLLIVGGVLLIALGTFWAVRNHNDKSAAPAETASQSTKGEPAQASSGASGSTTSSGGSTQPTTTTQPGDQKSAGGTTTTNLLAPSGDFVSAHHVSLGTVLTSVCNTSPGVNCSITFTSGSTTKSLAAQTTDRGGSAYWNNWTPQSIGLTPGSWTVQASATTGSQTKTANDALILEVAQ